MRVVVFPAQIMVFPETETLPELPTDTVIAAVPVQPAVEVPVTE